MTKKMKSAAAALAVNASSAANTTSEKITTPIITGYQYGDGGAFIGAYQFEKNLDKHEVHCPPCTVLCAPPANLAVDEEAFFDGEQWQVRKLSLLWLPDQTISDDKQNTEETSDGN